MNTTRIVFGCGWGGGCYCQTKHRIMGVCGSPNEKGFLFDEPSQSVNISLSCFVGKP